MEKVQAIQINRNRTLPNIKVPNLNVTSLYIPKKGGNAIDYIINYIVKEVEEQEDIIVNVDDLKREIESIDLRCGFLEFHGFWNFYNEVYAIDCINERFYEADEWLGYYHISLYERAFKDIPDFLNEIRAQLVGVVHGNVNYDTANTISEMIQKADYTNLITNELIKEHGIFKLIDDEMSFEDDLKKVMHNGEMIYFYQSY